MFADARRHIVRSVAAMHVLAARLVGAVSHGGVLLLIGELGSGKTTFVHGVARAVGVEQSVTSPSFTVVGDYTTHHPAIRRLVHIDLYRLENPDSDPAVAAIFEDIDVPGTLVVIEWADRLTRQVPRVALKLLFEHGAFENERVVTVQDGLYGRTSHA